MRPRLIASENNRTRDDCSAGLTRFNEAEADRLGKLEAPLIRLSSWCVASMRPRLIASENSRIATH